MRAAERMGNTDEVASLVFELLNQDLESRVLLDRLPRDWTGAPGNDAFQFYTNRPGYDGDRGVSWVNYFVGDQTEPWLHRGTTGMVMDSGSANSPGHIRVFDPVRTPVVDPANTVPISTQVFRIETAFLVEENGEVKIVDSAPLDADEFVRNEAVAALVVTIAVIDSKALPILPDVKSLTDLAAQFPDAATRSSSTLLGEWHKIAEDSQALSASASIPLAAAQSVRVYERIFYLR